MDDIAAIPMSKLYGATVVPILVYISKTFTYTRDVHEKVDRGETFE